MNFDPDTHQECLGYIRTAISSDDPIFVNQVLEMARKMCNSGHTTIKNLVDDLTQSERKQLDIWHKRLVRWHLR
jgi:hypothetical protein